MCLTLDNAADVDEHHVSSELGRGYCLTSHHSGYLAPGDRRCRSDPLQLPLLAG